MHTIRDDVVARYCSMRARRPSNKYAVREISTVCLPVLTGHENVLFVKILIRILLVVNTYVCVYCMLACARRPPKSMLFAKFLLCACVCTQAVAKYAVRGDLDKLYCSSSTRRYVVCTIGRRYVYVLLWGRWRYVAAKGEMEVRCGGGT
jgi:hypothetical protein